MGLENAIIVSRKDLKQHICVIDSFCRWLLVELGLKQNTIYNYRKLITRFLDKYDTEKPTKKQALDYVARMRESGHSYAHIVNTLRAIERYMLFIGSPVVIGKPRKPKTKIKSTLTEAEVAIIIAAAKDVREKAMMVLLAYSGVRNEELCNVRLYDVNLGSNLLHIRSGKGSRDRVIPIDGECVRVIMQYLAEYPRNDEDYLFFTKYGNRQYTPWALRRLVKSLAARAGIKKRIYPHLFRHSLATNMLHRGANPLTIQCQLGHSFIETTMIYVHSSPELLRAEYQVYSPSYT